MAGAVSILIRHMNITPSFLLTKISNLVKLISKEFSDYLIELIDLVNETPQYVAKVIGKKGKKRGKKRRKKTRKRNV